MSDKITKSPQIRFAGFIDAWEQRKLGDEFKKVNERNDGSFGKEHWISVAKMYFQDPEKVQSNNIDTRTYVMREGDIAFEGHPNAEFKFGRFVANDIGAGVVSELFPIYRHKGEYNNNYWKYAIQIERIMSPIFTKSITSSGNSSNKLDEKHFLRQSIFVPTIKEQHKIGFLFKSLDNLITIHQRRLELLKDTKKSLLQKMFPKDGANVPEIRFKGFTDAWEQRKLGEVFSYKQGQQIPVEDQYFENTGDLKRFIRIVDLTSINEPERFINYDGNNVVKTDDLFMIRYGQPGIVGYGYMGVIANNLFRLIPKIETVNLFYKYIFEFIYPQIKSLSSSTTMPALSFKSMDVLELKIPGIDEQQKIGNFFKQIDDSITLHQRELNSLKNLKKSLLQQMFV